MLLVGAGRGAARLLQCCRRAVARCATLAPGATLLPRVQAGCVGLGASPPPWAPSPDAVGVGAFRDPGTVDVVVVQVNETTAAVTPSTGFR